MVSFCLYHPRPPLLNARRELLREKVASSPGKGEGGEWSFPQPFGTLHEGLAQRMTKPRQIEEDTNKWNDILCLYIKRVNIVKLLTLPNIIYRFSAVPVKISMLSFIEKEKSILKYLWNHERSQIAQTILRK